MNLKFTIRSVFVAGSLLLSSYMNAQEVIVTDSTSIQPDAEVKKENLAKQGSQRLKF